MFYCSSQRARVLIIPIFNYEYDGSLFDCYKARLLCIQLDCSYFVTDQWRFCKSNCVCHQVYMVQ